MRALKRVFGDRTWALAGIGATGAAIAGVLGYPEAARGVIVGTPAGVLNHWMTRLAMGRWRGSATRGAAWVMGASSLRLLLAGALLWWAAGRGPAFLVGTLGGLLVETLDYAIRLPALLRRSGRG
ncbi:MAG TPA: ATP synthase subunit I [Limnochordales bacterium]